jgi:hypothetical protein
MSERQKLFNRVLPYLTQEQWRAARKAANEDDRGIIWWKIGEGKTRIAIAWMFLVAEHPKPLIICSPGAVRQWKDEIKLLGFTKDIEPYFISVGLLSRRDTIVVDFDLVNCLVADELWMFKNPKSKRSRMMTQLTRRFPSIGLSGSLMTAGNIEDLYGQSRAMNLDKKLATSLTFFRNMFEIETTNWAGFIQRFPKKGSVEAIQRRLVDNVDLYFPKETRDLRDIPTRIEPTNEQLTTKRKLVSTWLMDHDGETLEIKSAAVLLVKLLQVSDGFLKIGEGNYLPIRSNKIARLKELCSELFDAGEQQLLVWVAFRKTAQLLSAEMPYPSTILSGDGKFDIYGWRDGKSKLHSPLWALGHLLMTLPTLHIQYFTRQISLVFNINRQGAEQIERILSQNAVTTTSSRLDNSPMENSLKE